MPKNLIAALETGICINNSFVTIVHGMSRPIGALFHVPHGLSNAMLLCKCMEFAKDGATERFAELSRAVGAANAADSDDTAANKFIDGLFEICRECEVPTISGLPNLQIIIRTNYRAVCNRESE